MATKQEKPKPPTKLRLRVRELAEQQGITMAELAREAKIGLTTTQRVWRNSATGAIGGAPLESVHLRVLEDIAKVLNV